MSRRADTPRDLLFGLLALQTGLINPSALVLAFHSWTTSEGKGIADILLDQGTIEFDQRPLLEGLVAQHLKKYGNDVEKSLATIGLKAMAKSPEDRHPGPKPLAENLDRWAANEPSTAWKEPVARGSNAGPRDIGRRRRP